MLIGVARTHRLVDVLIINAWPDLQVSLAPCCLLKTPVYIVQFGHIQLETAPRALSSGVFHICELNLDSLYKSKINLTNYMTELLTRIMYCLVVFYLFSHSKLKKKHQTTPDVKRICLWGSIYLIYIWHFLCVLCVS